MLVYWASRRRSWAGRAPSIFGLLAQGGRGANSCARVQRRQPMAATTDQGDASYYGGRPQHFPQRRQPARHSASRRPPIDRDDAALHRFRKWTTTDAAAPDGARLEEVLDRTNTASEVFANTAYRSAKNEDMLARRGFVSRIHRKKPPGKPMPERTRLANAQKSKLRSAIEHRSGAGQDRRGQSRLQHAPLPLAADQIRARIGEAVGVRAPNRSLKSPFTRQQPPKQLKSTPQAAPSRQKAVPGGVHLHRWRREHASEDRMKAISA
jgi:hypothetical protein